MSKRLLIVAVLSLVMLAGFATQAMAADNDSVLITADVTSKITVTAGADIVWGPFEPDAANPLPVDQVVNVKANQDYTLSRTAVGTLVDEGMLSITGDAMDTLSTYRSAAGHDFAQTYALDLTPSGNFVDAGTYTATVTYTAVP